MDVQFKWIEFYTEFATKLMTYKNDRNELIQKIQNVYKAIRTKLPKLEKTGIPVDIDPFSVFGLFNKGITDKNRIRILNGIKKEFEVNAGVPDDFSGIPVLNNLMATFYGFKETVRQMISIICGRSSKLHYNLLKAIHPIQGRVLSLLTIKS